MDYDFRRPHRRVSVARPLAPSFAATQPHAVNVTMSTASTSSAAPATVGAGTTPAKKETLDFSKGAKAYKKRILKESLLHGFAISVYVLAGFTALLAAGGIYVNHKYAGRAIPFTYIGEISVGGLNEQQIKEALDLRVKEMQITFVDGGLTRTVPISQFAVTIDTAAVAHEATNEKFNPFAYLNKRRLEASVVVNERQVNGYIATTINPTKTQSENAKIVIEKKKLVIQPETQGFRTSPQFVNDRLKLALSTMSNPVINVNTVTLKPDVYATDLEDDLARANTLLNTTVALQYGKTTIKPSLDDKISWVQITETPGSNNVAISFSKPLIRQYVLAQAGKFQAGGITANNAADSATLVTQKGTVIDNIDEATDGLVAALNNGTAVTQKLTSKMGTYNKLVSTAQ